VNEIPRHAEPFDPAKLYVVITGSGSALPDPQRGGASAAIVIGGSIVQVDCGRGVTGNLLQAGLSPLDIDHLLFTHHHFDHIGEFNYYMISTWIAGRRRPVHVYGPPGTETMARGALAMHELDVGFVRHIAATWPTDVSGRPSADPPFIVRDVGAGVVFENDLVRVTAAYTPHLPGERSIAYRIDTGAGSVAISGDTGYSPHVVELARDVDLLLHECQLAEPHMVDGGKFGHEQAADDSKATLGMAHSSPRDVGRVGAEASPKRIVITHLAPYLSVPKARELSAVYSGTARGPEIWDLYVAAIREQYDGEVLVAEDGMTIEV